MPRRSSCVLQSPTGRSQVAKHRGCESFHAYQLLPTRYFQSSHIRTTSVIWKMCDSCLVKQNTNRCSKVQHPCLHQSASAFRPWIRFGGFKAVIWHQHGKYKHLDPRLTQWMLLFFQLSMAKGCSTNGKWAAPKPGRFLRTPSS